MRLADRSKPLAHVTLHRLDIAELRLNDRLRGPDGALTRGICSTSGLARPRHGSPGARHVLRHHPKASRHAPVPRRGDITLSRRNGFEQMAGVRVTILP